MSFSMKILLLSIIFPIYAMETPEQIQTLEQVNKQLLDENLALNQKLQELEKKLTDAYLTIRQIQEENGQFCNEHPFAHW